MAPGAYMLLDMTMEEIFTGVATVEPSAYPVFTALLKAYPKNHFTGVIQEVMMGGIGGIVDNNSLQRVMDAADYR